MSRGIIGPEISEEQTDSTSLALPFELPLPVKIADTAACSLKKNNRPEELCFSFILYVRVGELHSALVNKLRHSSLRLAQCMWSAYCL